MGSKRKRKLKYTSAIGMHRQVKRCVDKSKTEKQRGDCNVLNAKDNYKVLDIEPLSQFSLPVSRWEKKGIRGRIEERYHAGSDKYKSGRKAGLAQEMHWMWGNVLVSIPATKDNTTDQRLRHRTLRKSGCGLTSLTMALRYMQAKGSDKTFYDQLTEGLDDKHKPPNSGGPAYLAPFKDAASRDKYLEALDNKDKAIRAHARASRKKKPSKEEKAKLIELKADMEKSKKAFVKVPGPYKKNGLYRAPRTGDRARC